MVDKKTKQIVQCIT